MWVSVVLFLWCTLRVWGFTEVLMQLKELSVSEGLPVWFCPPVVACQLGLSEFLFCLFPCLLVYN